MQEAIKTARAIAGGDLSGKIVTSRHDDIGQMLRAMQQMNLYLAAMIGDVRSNMDTWRQRRRTSRPAIWICQKRGSEFNACALRAGGGQSFSLRAGNVIASAQ